MKKQFKIGYMFGKLTTVRARNEKEAVEIYCWENGIAYKDASNLVVKEVR